ncbi:hypothetical protein A0H76_1759 [Hepatospora eriocheir]|uniref:Uncharacterized protein n=1 Tax=Hepatospora eriocheir TaxID=1081669 RepID=A0A1X0QKH5_9MICR|nr:hypothetical protein A0H76_1759 [Hepatospora eriocheir]
MLNIGYLLLNLLDAKDAKLDKSKEKKKGGGELEKKSDLAGEDNVDNFIRKSLVNNLKNNFVHKSFYRPNDIFNKMSAFKSSKKTKKNKHKKKKSNLREESSEYSDYSRDSITEDN